MASGLGAFAGGIAEGYNEGERLRLAQQDMAMRKKMMDVQTQNAQRDLKKKQQEDDAFASLADYTKNYIANGGQAAPGQAPAAPGLTPQTDAAPGASASAASAPGGAGLQPIGDAAGMPEGPSTGASTAGPGLQKDGPQNPQEHLGFTLFQQPSLLQDQNYLNGAAKVLMASGSRAAQEKGLAYLNAGYTAQKENLLTAAKYSAFGDLKGAAAAFNARGAQKIDPDSLQYTDDKRTTVAGKMADGTPFSFQPGQVLSMFRTPDSLADEQLKRAELGVRERQVGAQEKQAEAASKRADAYDRFTTGAELWRQAQARNLDAKTGAVGQSTTKQVNDLVSKAGLALRHQLETEQPKEDAKYNTNGMMTLLPDMQAEIGTQIRNGTDPEIAFQQTLNTYHDRVSGLNDALAKIAADANGKWTSAGKDEAMRAGLQQFMGQYKVSPADIKKYLPATKLGKADADRIRSVIGSVSAGSVATGGAAPPPKAPAMPKTQADFDALQKGDPYVNPADGKTYIKN